VRATTLGPRDIDLDVGSGTYDIVAGSSWLFGTDLMSYGKKMFVNRLTLFLDGSASLGPFQCSADMKTKRKTRCGIVER
jgi:hypothetical protein